MKVFEQLSAVELQQLLDASALVTILIGAADGELDSEERIWSERLMHSRTYNKTKELNNFNTLVAEQFWVKLNAYMSDLSLDKDTRQAQITERLAALNPILAKLEVRIGAGIYKGLLGLAQETAKSSGGFLRIGAIGAEESKWVKLSMIEPIIAPKEESVETED